MQSSTGCPQLIKRMGPDSFFCYLSRFLAFSPDFDEAMQLIEHVKTAYNDIDVWDTGHGFEFQVIGATHATFHRHRLMTGHAWDAITGATLLYPKPPPTSILMLGLAGGTAVRQLRHFLPDAKITAVEIDKDIVELAQKYMHLNELEVEVVIDDAYAFITAPRTFDVVIDDVYVSGLKDVMRPRDIEHDVLRNLTRQVHEEGVVCTNLVTGAGHRIVQSLARKCFLETFAEVRVVTPPDSYNQTLVGGNALAPPRQLKPYGKTLPSSYDQRKWRQLQLKRLK